MPRVNLMILTVIILFILFYIFWKLSEPIDIESEKTLKIIPIVDEGGTQGRLSRAKVSIYYETLCPDSRFFLLKQFGPVYQKYGKYIDYELVPYGKAHTINGPDGLTFNCQHGEPECIGNKVHACSIYLTKDQSKLLEYINCMISDNWEPEVIGKKCAEKLGIHWESIRTCLHSSQSSELLKKYGEMTHGLVPSVSFIPTIEFNDSQDGQAQMLRDFGGFFCKRVLCI